jgi:hypothetical protein
LKRLILFLTVFSLCNPEPTKFAISLTDMRPLRFVLS